MESSQSDFAVGSRSQPLSRQDCIALVISLLEKFFISQHPEIARDIFQTALFHSQDEARRYVPSERADRKLRVLRLDRRNVCKCRKRKCVAESICEGKPEEFLQDRKFSEIREGLTGLHHLPQGRGG